MQKGYEHVEVSVQFNCTTILLQRQGVQFILPQFMKNVFNKIGVSEAAACFQFKHAYFITWLQNVKFAD